ncbi:MAG: DUF4397 domain-containing protein [Gemmatimonadota bacterium]|nr:DUF4397 domain-containing protein [Gemmatimonadota bacterium]
MFNTGFVMRLPTRVALLLWLPLIAACGKDATTACCTGGSPTLRVVNAFTTPVAVLIDGAVVVQSLAAASIGTAAPAAGSHTLVLRPIGTGGSVSQSITSQIGALNTIAAVRASNGAVATAVLDDTGSIVPSGATKVRVLHLAPNAGVLQVYRTQPDYQQPISWQFPFTYQATPDALSAPFFQSTVGSWEVRIWQTPADASGWATAPVKVVIPLKSGEKKTILILDKAGGGVRIEVI